MSAVDPCALVAVAPDKYAKGFDVRDGKPVCGPAVYRVTELRPALDAVYASDAHFVGYVCTWREDDGTIAGGTPGSMQPRLNKGGLRLARERGLVSCRVNVLVADVDNGEKLHNPWASDDEARGAVVRVKRLVPTCGVYATSGGLRIVQPMTRAIEVEQYELVLASWLAELAGKGIASLKHLLDCRDWTRHYRLPHVVREGRRA